MKLPANQNGIFMKLFCLNCLVGFILIINPLKSKLKESVVSKNGPYQYCTCKNDTRGKRIMCTKECK